MTEREREILDIIKENPSVSLSEIAERLQISRNTVAVHISNLSKEGFLLGKAYIVKEEDYFVGIGAANVDLYGKSEIAIREHYDHPAKIHTSPGGVSRNILDVLSRLDVRTKLLSAVGDDFFGELILKESARRGIDMNDVLVVKGAHSGIFMQVLDDHNDMHLALCDMSVNEHIDIPYLREKEKILQGAKAIAFDPSLPVPVLEYLLDHYSKKALFLDPVSDLYAEKIRPYLSKIFAVKPNRTELEVLSQHKIRTKEDLIEAGRNVLEKGVQRIYISLGEGGCLYMDKDQVIEKSFRPEKHVVNASGAGDSFFAGIIYGYMNDLSVEESLNYALAAGIMAIRSDQPINADMNTQELQKIIKENEEWK
ncbi:MAG: winged helix-turn-helix transcriptional regulator [Erysipelotrichaceae bacterium]|nr:winged helix-turn-helix transcriptional regulator [Erysipelotrichaceae bacterium]